MPGGRAVGLLSGGAAARPFWSTGRCSRQLHGTYALPLLLEAHSHAAVSAWWGPSRWAGARRLPCPVTVLLLAYLMGLQNAVVTKMSSAQIRTTHMTGVVTDLGIEMGKMLYWNRSGTAPERYVRANRDRLRLFAGLAAMFLVGGLVGAAGFKYVGFIFVLPLALVLLTLSLPPLWTDRNELRRAACSAACAPGRATPSPPGTDAAPGPTHRCRAPDPLLRRPLDLTVMLQARSMQTQLAPEYAARPDGQEAEAILRKCVHCGFCTATCPTYQLLGDELDGPRGRIYLIKQVLEGADAHARHADAPGPVPDLPQLRKHLPSGVQYGHLVDIGRKIVDERCLRPAGEKAAALGAEGRPALAAVCPCHEGRARPCAACCPRAIEAKVPAPT